MEIDGTPPPAVGSVSVKISPEVISGGDLVAAFDVEQVEDIDDDVELFVAIGTNMNPRKWMKKCEPQVSELDKLKLKAVVLHDSIGKEVHITQPVQFVATDLITVA